LNDRPVIVETISTFIGLGIEIFVIVGYQKSLIERALSSIYSDELRILSNPDYKSGMSTSIKAAMQKIGNNYDYFGFSNGDMPFILTETVSTLMEELQINQPLILAPSYRNRTGHPVFFRSDLKDELNAISGDVGGREVIKNHQSELRTVPVADEGVVTDMDYYLEKIDV